MSTSFNSFMKEIGAGENPHFVERWRIIKLHNKLTTLVFSGEIPKLKKTPKLLTKQPRFS